MYSQYSIKVIEHFMSPQNVGSMVDYDGAKVPMEILDVAIL